jgi:hypothetical protein
VTRFADKIAFVTSGIGRATALTRAAFTVGHAVVVDGGQTA